MKRKIQIIAIFIALTAAFMFMTSCGGISQNDIEGYWIAYDGDVYYFDGNGGIINYNSNGDIYSEDVYKIKGKKIEMIDAEDGDIIKTFTYKSKDTLYDNGRNTEFTKTDSPFDSGSASAATEEEVMGYWSISSYVYYFDGDGNVTVYYEDDGSIDFVDKYRITRDEYREYVELIDADDGDAYRTINIEGDGVMYAPDYDEEYKKLPGNPF